MKTILFLILSLLIAQKAWAVPPVWTTGQGAIQDTNELTIGLDITGITNGALYVGCGLNTSGVSDFTSMVWNGTENLAEVDNFHDGGSLRVVLWEILNPTAGAFDLVITQSGTVPMNCGVLALSGVNQTTSTGTAVNSSSFDTASVDVSSASGDLVIDVVYWEVETPGTVGGGQTLEVSQLSTNNTYITMSTEPGAAGVITMSWSGSGFWSAQIGVSVKPAAAAAVTTRRRAVIGQ